MLRARGLCPEVQCWSGASKAPGQKKSGRGGAGRWGWTWGRDSSKLLWQPDWRAPNLLSGGFDPPGRAPGAARLLFPPGASQRALGLADQTDHEQRRAEDQTNHDYHVLLLPAGASLTLSLPPAVTME